MDYGSEFVLCQNKEKHFEIVTLFRFRDRLIFEHYSTFRILNVARLRHYTYSVCVCVCIYIYIYVKLKDQKRSLSRKKDTTRCGIRERATTRNVALEKQPKR